MMGSREVALRYEGSEVAPQAGVWDQRGREYRPYVVDGDLQAAVELAIALEMPLLLEGDPGCGKTCLAGAIAYEFTIKLRQRKQLKAQEWYPFEVWNVTSMSRAVDGKYSYDALRRLRDAQLAGSNLRDLKEYLGDEEVTRIITDLKDRKRYRSLGALGQVLGHEKLRPILLIDEIDKADSDFPNDLLREIEEFRFEIPETGEIIPDPARQKWVKKPIILITSNREKPLPDPFLRRCVYYYVGFPESERLRTIVRERFGALDPDREQQSDRAIALFYAIRTLLDQRPGSRPPGTSEFLKWLQAILYSDWDPEESPLDYPEKYPALLGILAKQQADVQWLQAQLPTVIGQADAGGDDD